MISRQALSFLTRRSGQSIHAGWVPRHGVISAASQLRGFSEDFSVERADQLRNRLTPQSISSSGAVRFFSSEGSDKKDDAVGNEERATAEEAATDGDTPEETPSTEASMEEKLQEEVKSLKDQLLRSLAEQENIRNIAKRDISDARQFAIKSFAKSLLEVADNLQRALDSVPDADLESNEQLNSLFQGIDMTNTGLAKAFEANGVKRFCEVPGEKFDPSLHNALMQYPDAEKEPDTVGQVIKVGYTLNDRVLRPAEVGVVKAA